MPPLLLVNPRSGSGDPPAAELEAAARDHGVTVRILEQGEDPGEVARSTAADAIGMAGGDGSLGAVAAVALERDVPFVCIPFGTRNHFARDIGLDRDDPIGALAAFDGDERRIDVGRVGERVFLNNVSLGVYARLVHRRERHRRRSEVLAQARALAGLVRRPQPLHVTVNGEPLSARVILVANNHYQLDLFSLGERERLDEGLLHLYAPAGFLRGNWTERTGPKFVVDASRHRLRAAIDGEPAALETPITFTIEAAALRVLVPRA